MADKPSLDKLADSFTKQELAKLANIMNENYIRIMKWLYDNHRDILREYEKKELKTKLKINFA
jgi:hypothetical protein